MVSNHRQRARVILYPVLLQLLFLSLHWHLFDLESPFLLDLKLIIRQELVRDVMPFYIKWVYHARNLLKEARP